MIKESTPQRLGNHWFIGISGDPGVGKTTLCALAPDPLFIDTGTETMVLAYTEGLEQTRVIHVDTSSEASEVVNEVKAGKIKCGTLILDNMSDLQFMQLKKSSQSLKTGRSRDGVIVPILEDYNISTVQCRDMIDDFQKSSFPCNVIIITHRLEVTKDGSLVSTRVNLTEKLAGRLNGAVTANLILTQKINSIKGTVERTLRANPTTTIQAKNRLGLPDEFPAADLWQIMKGKQ